METVKIWAYSLCIYIVACEIVSLLLPQNNNGRLVKYIMSVLIVLILCRPIRERFEAPELQIDSEVVISNNSSEFNSIITEQYLNTIKSLTYESVEEFTEIPKEKIKDIVIETSRNDDNSINVEGVVIYLNGSIQINIAEVSQTLSKIMGIKVEVALNEDK